MSILSGILGRSQKDVWQQFCRETGALFIERSFWKGDYDQVSWQREQWTLAIDSIPYSREARTGPFTRIRAPFVSADKLRFKIHPAGMFAKIETLFRMQDVVTGLADYDGKFLVQGNNADGVKKFLQQPEVRELTQLPRSCLQINRLDRATEGEIFELHFEVQGEIRDVAQLKRLADLFVAALDQLQSQGSAAPVQAGQSQAAASAVQQA